MIDILRRLLESDAKICNISLVKDLLDNEGCTRSLVWFVGLDSYVNLTLYITVLVAFDLHN